MARDIWDFVLACSVCARGKTSNRPPEGLLQPLSVPSRPWSHIALDFVTALPPSQDNTVVLTIVDRFSKAAHFIPLPKLPSAKETAVTVVDHVFRIHGLPMDVVSDRGPQFVSKFWRKFCRLLGASVSLSSGFHPQSNGQTEWANQDLERVLRCLVAQNPASWSQQLSWVEYAHNSLPVSSTGLSPFECSLGYQPPIFPNLESEVAVPSAHAFVQKCRHTWRRARETLLRVGARTKAQVDRHRSKPPLYVVGQKVWLSSKHIPLRSVCNKLAPKFIGPFTVTKILNPVAVRLKLPPVYWRIHFIFHVSKLKPVFHSPINPPAPVPPPAAASRRRGTNLFGQPYSGLKTEVMRILVPGGLGGLRSGGEKLGSCQGHSGSLPYWWLQSMPGGAPRRKGYCHGIWVHWLILALCVCVCVGMGVSVIAADGLISVSWSSSAPLFKTCAICPVFSDRLVFLVVFEFPCSRSSPLDSVPVLCGFSREIHGCPFASLRYQEWLLFCTCFIWLLPSVLLGLSLINCYISHSLLNPLLWSWQRTCEITDRPLSGEGKEMDYDRNVFNINNKKKCFLSKSAY